MSDTGESVHTEGDIIVMARRGRASTSIPLAACSLGGSKDAGSRRRPSATEQAGAQVALRSAEGAPATATIRPARAPRRDASLKVSIDVDPATPPGTYERRAEIDGDVIPLTVVVPRQRRLRLSASRITVETGKETRLEESIVVENRGNVTIELARTYSAALEPVDRSCRLLRPAPARTGEAGMQGLLDSLVAEAAASTLADPIVGASLAPESACTLEPGCTRRLRLALRIPRPAEGHHRARLEIGGRRLMIDVIGW